MQLWKSCTPSKPSSPQLKHLATAKVDLTAVRVELAPVRDQLDGLPPINRTGTVIQQDVRSLKAAFNDFALTSPTTGEIEALHADANRVQAETPSLPAKVATLERLVRGLQDARH